MQKSNDQWVAGIQDALLKVEYLSSKYRKLSPEDRNVVISEIIPRLILLSMNVSFKYGNKK